MYCTFFVVAILWWLNHPLLVQLLIYLTNLVYMRTFSCVACEVGSIVTGVRCIWI